MEVDRINGLTEEVLKDNGNTAKCKVKVISIGSMAENIMVIMRMTRKVDLEYLNGQMEGNTKETG
jgi:hypothetical protein